MSRVIVRVAVVAVVGLALVAVGVAPQLSARVSGEEHLLRVRPVDPIDPFRGAYVALDYPDLRHDGSRSAEGGLGAMEDGERGRVFVVLAEDPAGEGLMRATEFTRTRPEGGVYLACDDREWQIRCGIESLFLPQDEALEMESAVASGHAVARVRIDGRGHAALVGVDVR